MSKPFLLAILDGYGLSEPGPYNACTTAKTPCLDALMQNGFATLDPSGEAVGLPAGQMGNSEVGHTNIGAGRIVYQELTRISKEAREGKLALNPVVGEAMRRAKKSALHLVGLVSTGGVHSHKDHLYALLQIAKDAGVEKIYIHGILDGRDVAPTSAKEEIDALRAYTEQIGAGELVSLVGRFYAMDRDNRWERVQKAYDLFVKGEGVGFTDTDVLFDAAYARGNTDEFFEPAVKLSGGLPVGRIEDDDVFLFFNFRPDRAREIVRAFADPDFVSFPRDPNPSVCVVTMTRYDESIPNTHVIYPKEVLSDTLGEVLAKNGLRQMRIAETEKYAHVTFFLSGGRETPFPGETRILIPSPKVATYDLQPEMRAKEVADLLIEGIQKDLADVYVVNFANPDMVGHTGIMEAATTAVEAVDAALARVLEALEEKGGEALITADHGNCEVMRDETGNPVTSHSTNRVALLHVGSDRALNDGILADIAPTILAALHIQKPEAMSGHSLWK